MIRLRDEQWERIRDHFPEEKIADGRPGRKPISTRCVLEAVLWILNTGAQWHMLPQSYPNYKTVHRRFQTWCRDEVLRRVLTDVANELRDRGALNEEECFIDATFVMAKGGGSEIGTTKRGKGMKIMAIVDRHGLPLSVSTHAANHHEVRLVQLCFDFYMIEAKPENLIGDRAYDSDPLDAELRKDGIEMIAPHRGNRSKPPTQDRRRLSRYMRRWLVERFFAWIQWQRRILIRWEYHAHNLDSIFSSMRSMRRALGFIGAGPLARSVCPVASNPVGDLVHAGFELL
jgi:transposase